MRSSKSSAGQYSLLDIFPPPYRLACLLLTQRDFTPDQGTAAVIAVGPEVYLVDGLVDVVVGVSEASVGAGE